IARRCLAFAAFDEHIHCATSRPRKHGSDLLPSQDLIPLWLPSLACFRGLARREEGDAIPERRESMPLGDFSRYYEHTLNGLSCSHRIPLSGTRYTGNVKLLPIFVHRCTIQIAAV